MSLSSCMRNSQLMLVVGLMLSLVGSNVYAKGGDTQISSKRGLFSLNVGYDYSEMRMLNTDSTYSSFKGGGVRGEIELSLTDAGPGEFRLFGGFSQTTLDGVQDKSDSLKNNATFMGAKVFASNWLFLGAAYGTLKQDIEAEGSSASVSNKTLSAGFGIEFPLTGNWYLGLSGWYQLAPLAKNSDLETTSYAEGGSAYLSIIWSPPSTVITQALK